jgi:hypothetical protein
MNQVPAQNAAVDEESGLTRRSLLLSVLILWTAGSTIRWRGINSWADSIDPGKDAMDWLYKVTGQREAVIRLGKAYLSLHAAEREPNRLLHLIDRALVSEQRRDMQFQETSPSIDALIELVRNEYRLDNVVDLNGWVVSRTEARLYALVAALQGE